MDALVASLEDIKFDIETALEEQHGALPLPFPGMDSKYQVSMILWQSYFKIATNFLCLRIHCWSLYLLRERGMYQRRFMSYETRTRWS